MSKNKVRPIVFVYLSIYFFGGGGGEEYTLSTCINPIPPTELPSTSSTLICKKKKKKERKKQKQKKTCPCVQEKYAPNNTNIYGAI